MKTSFPANIASFAAARAILPLQLYGQSYVIAPFLISYLIAPFLISFKTYNS